MMMMINSQSHELKITNSFNRQSEYLLDVETIKTKAPLPSHSLHDTQFHPSALPQGSCPSLGGGGEGGSWIYIAC